MTPQPATAATASTAPSPRVWSGLLLLALASFAGDRLCRSAAPTAAEQGRLLQLGGAAVHRLPESFGLWRQVSNDPLDADTLAILQCDDHENRVYANSETGERVALTLLVGKAGPMVAHTPEVCYSSAAFDVVETAKPREIRTTGPAPDTFDRIVFRSNSVAGEKQTVYYAWRRAVGAWEAPKDPRLTLGGAPVLYKLQLASTGGDSAAETDSETGTDSENGSEVCRRFLDDLLPVLDEPLTIR